ncbi:Sodium/hydrogen exchanger family-domain-containing protein [Apiospora phragmitis]|uniref:Sodium/hydrogen exchanger family-domain-containing protein n=1 Tax=Apiospora phragmitis TaxID=2905665 RepID=A0ABR1WUX2_9PEZI
MPTLDLTDFNILTALLGGFISVFGLVSYLVKENFYLSEALISLLVGVAFSPAAANLIRPLDYAHGSQDDLNDITLYFSRLVLGVQLVLAGIQLPSRYLKKEWKPLSILLGLVMTLMWLVTSLLIWALVPHLPYLHALAVAACVTPTDPVLSNVIVKGKFADKNVPKELQKIIIAESGANDGLGYPFLFFALYLIKYVGDGSNAADGGAREAMGEWFGETWGYTILLSVIYGAVVGKIFLHLLHFAEEKRWVDRESFLVFALSLALFITGTCGMIGSDDVLACFIAGNTFTSLQPTIDMLLNVAIFMWYGAVCPWSKFLNNDVIPIYRLIPLGILILLFRRPPVILAVHKFIPQIENIRLAIFMGFFGPVGVSGIFYLYITLLFLDTLKVDGQQRADVATLGETVEVVVWFVTICSVVIHGLSIPLGKFGVHLPRTISRSLKSPSDEGGGETPFRIRGRVSNLLPPFRAKGTARNPNEVASPPISRSTTSARPLFQIGGSIIPEDTDRQVATSGLPNRTIRFPDEDLSEPGHNQARPAERTQSVTNNEQSPSTTAFDSQVHEQSQPAPS